MLSIKCDSYEEQSNLDYRNTSTSSGNPVNSYFWPGTNKTAICVDSVQTLVKELNFEKSISLLSGYKNSVTSNRIMINVSTIIANPELSDANAEYIKTFETPIQRFSLEKNPVPLSKFVDSLFEVQAWHQTPEKTKIKMVPGRRIDNLSLSYKWISENKKKRVYKGKWVALKGEKLLGFSDSLSELKKNFVKNDKQVLITKLL